MREFFDAAVGGEHVNDVAERILARLQAAVGAGLDAPAQHVLAVVVARREAQRPGSSARTGRS